MKLRIIQKQNNIILILIIIVTMIFSGCSNEEPAEPVATAEPVPVVTDVTLTTYNQFAIDLLKATRGSDDNVILNPVTAGITLTMFDMVAQGDTATGIEETLNMQFQDINLITQSASVVMTKLEDLQGANFSNGFALYVNEGPTIREDFAVRMEDYFKLDLNFIDFSEERLEIEINDWASDVSTLQIDTIFSPDEIDHNIKTFMLSVSSVNCVWNMAFDSNNTRSMPFLLDNELRTSIAVPTMRGKMQMQYYSDDEVTVGFLPLSQEKTTLAIFLPNEENTLGEFLEEFSQEDIALWRALSYDREKWIFIPKVDFSTVTPYELSSTLTQMGASNMFDEELADFSELGTNFHLDKFYQASQITIQEEGDLESDITAVDITRAQNNDEEFFIVDRTFVFALIDEETGGILMIGTIANPIEQ